MKLKKYGKLTLAVSLGMAVSALADNPISNYHYLADPAATADDETFYIITDSDDPAGGDGYTIKSLYAFSSRDMKNWTDYGIIYEAKREDDNVNDIWASGIAFHEGMFHIVFPDGGGGGIGYVRSKNINGPYENPVQGGKKLIGWGDGGISDCDGIGWCFDPAIFFDDDGSAYFTFGGGESDSHPNNDNFNIYKFNSDLTSFDVGSKTRLKVSPNDGTKTMEASYIHKKGSTYYLSYSTTDLRIAYATSDKVMGPYNYKGIFMDNPNINGRNINANNNNHHGIAEFKGKWYVVYHDRRLVSASEHPASLGNPNPEPAYHRSVSIDEFTYNGDNMNKLTFTDDGPKQIANFDPFQPYPAITSSKQRNIRSRTDWTRGKAVQHVLTPYASKESWIRVSGVDFGTGATGFRVTAANVGDGNKIEIHSGSVSGTLVGTCELQKTSGWKDYADTECEVSGLTGVVDQLFIVFKGSKDSTMGILEWEFVGAGGSTPKTPYGGTAAEIPGVLQAELFDEGGARKGFVDDDAENQGDADFRTTEGVDIVKGGTGMAVGYTGADEWMDFTVNVKADGQYPLTVYAASGADNSSLLFLVDGKAASDTVKVPQTDTTWNVYKEIDGGTVALTAGEHVIRMLVTGAYVNVDWFSIGDVEKPTSIRNTVKYANPVLNSYRVYSLAGKLMGTVDLTGRTPQQALSQAGYSKGVYVLKGVRSGKMLTVSTSK